MVKCSYRRTLYSAKSFFNNLFLSCLSTSALDSHRILFYTNTDASLTKSFGSNAFNRVEPMALSSETLPLKKRMEALSFAYLRAVCAKIGAAVERHFEDGDGVDGIVKKKVLIAPVDQGDLEPYPLDASFAFQLKSTAQALTEDDEFLHYPLKAKNYNDLVGKASTKRLLLLLVLPSDFESSVVHTLESLTISRCMYWHDLSGLDKSDNVSTVTVKIPKKNVASPEGIDALLQRIAEET